MSSSLSVLTVICYTEHCIATAVCLLVCLWR